MAECSGQAAEGRSAEKRPAGGEAQRETRLPRARVLALATHAHTVCVYEMTLENRDVAANVPCSLPFSPLGERSNTDTDLENNSEQRTA